MAGGAAGFKHLLTLRCILGKGGLAQNEGRNNYHYFFHVHCILEVRSSILEYDHLFLFASCLDVCQHIFDLAVRKILVRHWYLIEIIEQL
jgi:hypothetical protein